METGYVQIPEADISKEKFFPSLPSLNASSVVDKTKDVFWMVLSFVLKVVTLDENYVNACKTCCSSLELNCFDISRFIFFILGTVIIPYTLYHKVGDTLNWTQRRDKTLSQHFETVMTAVASMTTLWFLGNYQNTFDWVSFLAVQFGVLLFGYVTEMPFAHHSLTTVKNWSTQLWTVMISIVVVIVGMAGYHIYLATKTGGDNFWKIYTGSLLVPMLIAYMSYQVVQSQNADPAEKKKSKLHIHHIHIFYALAFFTRFPNILSRIAAGLVIGCSMHGVAAYNYDTTFEH